MILTLSEGVGAIPTVGFHASLETFFLSFFLSFFFFLSFARQSSSFADMGFQSSYLRLTPHATCTLVKRGNVRPETIVGIRHPQHHVVANSPLLGFPIQCTCRAQLLLHARRLCQLDAPSIHPACERLRRQLDSPSILHVNGFAANRTRRPSCM
jgi:hypothetical protein